MSAGCPTSGETVGRPRRSIAPRAGKVTWRLDEEAIAVKLPTSPSRPAATNRRITDKRHGAEAVTDADLRNVASVTGATAGVGKGLTGLGNELPVIAVGPER